MKIPDIWKHKKCSKPPTRYRNSIERIWKSQGIGKAIRNKFSEHDRYDSYLNGGCSISMSAGRIYRSSSLPSYLAQTQRTFARACSLVLSTRGDLGVPSNNCWEATDGWSNYWRGRYLLAELAVHQLISPPIENHMQLYLLGGSSHLVSGL